MRGVRPYSTADLETMRTKQLLAHLERLRVCEPSIDAYAGQPFPPDYRPDGLIYFNEDPRWDQQYAELKRILARREHVPRSPQRKSRRIRKAAENRAKPRERPKSRRR